MSHDNYASCWKDLEKESTWESLTDFQLLTLLDNERQKFTRADNDFILKLIVKLQNRGVYPKETIAGNPCSVEDMVLGYGAHWHEWSGPLKCPSCKADLRDLSAGPPFKREIGIVKNDRVSTFICPECKNPI